MEVDAEPTRLLPTPSPDSDDEDMEDKPWSTDGIDIREPDVSDPLALRVESVDFNIAVNGQPHHTSEYEEGGLNELVVRRGQPFDIDVTFSRPYDKQKDDIKLIFQFVCRTLGIPARSITNFASAHDTNGSVTIDSYFKAGGEKIEWRSGDSVWNFHLWNDVWMARPDLPDGYGGWQAIDGTPQERSDGTTAERISVITANASGTYSDKNIYELKDDQKDVKFNFEVSETFKYGEPFDVTVELSNTSAEKRTVNGRVTSHTTYYTGVNYCKVKKMNYHDVILKPKQKKITVGKPFNVNISFRNPLSDDLTDCVLSIEVPGIQKAKQIPQNNVKGKQEFVTAVEMTAAKKGNRKIIANFDSKQLEGVVGGLTVIVQPDSV
ncbi:hypothetical protein KUTeg_019810 [Tegillarca granosa]|uniref:Transglutaminase-like domain-containing protein n=1 Tax=Tegillarca granosa TaxID=220873 RepID=A0ABQ9EDN5_TEGGR|nr:hypothetical protein KUTeg_019810 [Tegillarca granosa]